MNRQNDIRVSLFLLRAGIFIVMFMWTIDKFVRPGHAAAVFENFYYIKGLSSVLSYVIGAAETILLAGFILGYLKTLTYGAVLVLHGISTLSSFRQYLSPFEGPNLLFFAAWPMLAACIVLFLLRDRDTLLAVEKSNPE